MTTEGGLDAIARTGIRCMLLRGGTSKGALFLDDDLPADPVLRAEVLLRVMGSPDPREIDGLGGAHPLTSKAAAVAVSDLPGVDIDYTFYQIVVDEPRVVTTQTCGNLLAAVGPFAIERGLVAPRGEKTRLRIRLVNTGDIAMSEFATPGGRVEYAGDAAIAGVPGTAAPIHLEITPTRPLLPTGSVVDDLAGHRVTLIDNGMPVVLLAASALGVAGRESPAALEGDPELARTLEEIRLLAGPLFGLGNVAAQTVPKMILVSPPGEGGDIATRAFIPHRVHASIGVLMAASVAAGARIPGTVAADVATTSPTSVEGVVAVEHPSGSFPADVRVVQDEGGAWHASSLSLRTARRIFDGTVYPRP